MAADGSNTYLDNITLLDIVKSFNGPITEEHAFTILYQCVKKLMTALHSGFPKKLDNIFVRADGTVNFTENSIAQRGNACKEYAIFSLGRLIYLALDYGLEEDEERHLSAPLDDLIDRMTDDANNKEDAVNIIDDNDEGIEESWSDDELDTGSVNNGMGIKSGDLDGPIKSFHTILRLCAAHLHTPQDAGHHYQCVCRALHSEATQLQLFLHKVHSTNRAVGATHPRCENMDELSIGDWARMWVQVMRELRNGVQLKKVNFRDVSSIEFELTPYEMMMEDIRTRRYELRKVVDREELAPRLRRTARELILDFIRSRPPLQSVRLRLLQKAPSGEKGLHETMMDQIQRTLHSSLKHVSNLPNPHRGILLGRVLESTDGEVRTYSQTHLLKLTPGDDFSNDLDDVSTDDDMSSIADSVDTLTVEGDSERDQNDFDDELDYLQTSNTELSTPTGRRRYHPLRRHSLSSCPSPRPDKSQSESWRIRLQPNIGLLTEDIVQDATPSVHMDYLCLTIEEVIHIRGVLTNADLDNMLLDQKLHDDVLSDRICFSCRTYRFGVFKRAYKCKLCQKMTCKHCIRTMAIPTEHYLRVPVSCLSPSASPGPRLDHDSSSTAVTPTRTNDLETVDTCKDCKSFIHQIYTSSLKAREKALKKLHASTTTHNLETAY